MDAVLEKIRMPNTTTTAVVMADPTPSWVPRNTRRQATTTFQKKEVTKTRSAKRPSSHARPAPKRVQEHPEGNTDDQADDRNHCGSPSLCVDSGVAYWAMAGESPAMDRVSTLFVETVIPVTDWAADR